MTDYVKYRKAAELIFMGKEAYCCHALDEVALRIGYACMEIK